MSVDPFCVTGPALIANSGGESSAMLTERIVRAHGGKLPDDVIVNFCNTGLERNPETFTFLRRQSEDFGVPFVWTEWRPKVDDVMHPDFSLKALRDSGLADLAYDIERYFAEPSEHGYEVVGYNSASQNGAPFAALVAKKGYLPNRGGGYCSIELKTRVAKNYAMQAMGWEHWTSVVGFRHDEQSRVMGMVARNYLKKERFTTRAPLDRAAVAKRDVLAHWEAKPYRLGLLGGFNNCELCWKKSLPKRVQVLRHRPDVARFYAALERAVPQGQSGSRFDEAQSVEQLATFVINSPMFDLPIGDDEPDEECGGVCAAEIELGEAA